MNLADNDYWLEISLKPVDESNSGYSSAVRISLDEVAGVLPHFVESATMAMPYYVRSAEQDVQGKKKGKRKK